MQTNSIRHVMVQSNNPKFAKSQPNFKANIIAADKLTTEFVDNQLKSAKENGTYSEILELKNRISSMHKNTTLLLMARKKSYDSDSKDLFEYSVRNLSNLSEIHYDTNCLAGILKHIIAQEKKSDFWKSYNFITPIQYFDKTLKGFENRTNRIW